MRLIDADALLERVWDADTRVGYVQVVDRKDIEDAPTIEERKTGKWLYKEDGWADWYECSLCRCKCPRNSFGKPVDRTPFCPSCGADMRGEDNV